MAVCLSRTVLAGIGILNSYQVATGLAGAVHQEEDTPITEGPNFDTVQRVAKAIGLTKPISLFYSSSVFEPISVGSNLPFGKAKIFLPRETPENRYTSQDMRDYFVARQVLAIKSGVSFLPQLVGLITSIAVFILLTPYAPLAASFAAFFVHCGTMFLTLRHLSQKLNREVMGYCSDLSLKTAKVFWNSMEQVFNNGALRGNLDFKDRANVVHSWMLNGFFKQRAKEIDAYLKVKEHRTAVPTY